MPKFNLSNDETQLVIESIDMSLQGLLEHQLCQCGLEDCASLLDDAERDAHAEYGMSLQKLLTRFESRLK